MEDNGSVRMPLSHTLDHFLSVWQAEGCKLAWVEVVCPRVKQLHDLSSSLYLVAHIVCNVASQMTQQCMQHCRVLHHHCLGLGAVPAGNTTDTLCPAKTNCLLLFVPCQSNMTCHKGRNGSALMSGLITARVAKVMQGRMRMHECAILLVCFALNAVCSQSPWRANKAKDCCLVADF